MQVVWRKNKEDTNTKPVLKYTQEQLDTVIEQCNALLEQQHDALCKVLYNEEEVFNLLAKLLNAAMVDIQFDLTEWFNNNKK